MKPYVPLGILSVSSYLKSNGIGVELFDSTFEIFESQKKKIIELKPDIIGIYCNLMTKLNVLRLIRFIRSEKLLTNTLIVLGGPEPANYAEEYINYGADVIVKGEGEQTMLELCTTAVKGRDFSDVSGIIFRDDNGKIVYNNEREKIKNIDDLPLPDRKAVDMNLYLNAWEKAHGYSSISVSTMRGCPYTCRWCSHTVYGISYRRRSAVNVADELELLMQTYKPDMFWFVDDVFTVSHKWLYNFSNEIKRRNLKISYECISRSDRLNEDVIKLLRSSGCDRLWIGAESGSQKVLDLMDRRVSAADTRIKIKLARKNGIRTGTFIMLGYPGETIDDIEETVKHLIDSEPDEYLTTVAYPIKGTPFYEQVESHVITNKSWDNRTDRDLDFNGRYPLRFYKHANRYLINQVNYHRLKQSNVRKLSICKTFLKARISRLMMSITK